MLEATRIAVGYDDNEDRIFIDFSGAERQCRLWLTRRITRRLWSAIMDILERSSPIASKTPADMRQEVIAFEHLSAISRPEPAAGAGPDAKPVERSAALLAKVDISFTAESFRLVFHAAAEPAAALTIGRAELHKVLALLDQSATAAEWDLGVATDWLRWPNRSAPEKLAS
ncbi:MAG TPA: hypothetical protein VKZ79_08615 [Alphaproteobacteria bacterium]|nr:hypothetical protein [Alphaproteobacteria bacterium]